MSKKIFIHIPKNAGMSIRHSPYLADKILVAGADLHKNSLYTKQLNDTMKSLGDHHGNEHSRWRDLDPAYTGRYKAFAVIRNPWDRVVSRFFFAKKVIEVEQKVPTSYADVSSFESFLEERHKWGNREFMWHRAIRGWYPAVDHITDLQGNLVCDMISYENYEADLCDYFQLEKMSRPRNVTALNKGTYMDLYTPETIQIVADWYKADIDMFGYDFDTGPTRNTWRLLNE